MQSRRAMLLMLEAIDQSEIEYIIVGALATNVYAFARATKDADFVLGMKPAGIEAIASRLPPEFQIDPQLRMELSTGTFRWIVRVTGLDFFFELFQLGDDPHHREEFARRRQVEFPAFGRSAWVASAEDLVIQKLRWRRTKDVDDVRNILSVQRDALDFVYLERWCREHGTSVALHEILASLPKLEK